MKKFKIEKTNFGITNDGNAAHLFSLETKTMKVLLSDFGARVVSIFLKKQNLECVLRYDNLESYENDDAHFGSVIGRFANRIRGGVFSCEGKTYTLTKNDGENTLHSGSDAWDKKVWQANINAKKNAIDFFRFSKEGEQGFPGNLYVRVRYELKKNKLCISYTATSDKTTPVNFTNHTYFNFSQDATIEKHFLRLYCKRFLETDDELLPTGKICKTKKTVFDFLKKKQIDFYETEYDTCFVTNAFQKKSALGKKKLVKVARLFSPDKNVSMCVRTNLEGLHVYTGNFLQTKHQGICFETEIFPNSPNEKKFPDCFLRGGKTFKSKTTWEFRS